MGTGVAMIDDQLIRKVQRFMHDDSLAWQALVQYANAAIQDRREALDNPELDAIKTAIVRGEIKALKELLALPTLVTQVAQRDPGYGVTIGDD